MTVRSLIIGVALLGALAAFGCGGGDGSDANPQMQTKDAPTPKKMTPAGGPGAPGGAPAPAAGGKHGPTPVPQ